MGVKRARWRPVSDIPDIPMVPDKPGKSGTRALLDHALDLMVLPARNRAAAEADLLSVAGLFLQAKLNQKNSPRKVFVRANLNAIANSADALRHNLVGLDHFSIGFLYEWARTGGRGAPSWGEVMLIDAGDELRSETLSLLADLATHARKRSEKVGVDRGGNPPLWPDNPEETLVRGCDSLVRCHEGKIIVSTTDGGPFRDLVSIVHEIATGENRDLEFHVKKVLHDPARNTSSNAKSRRKSRRNSAGR